MAKGYGGSAELFYECESIAIYILHIFDWNTHMDINGKMIIHKEEMYKYLKDNKCKVEDMYELELDGEDQYNIAQRLYSNIIDSLTIQSEFTSLTNILL